MLDNIGRLFINTLAVGGAFLLVTWLAELILWASCRYFLHKPPPPKARKIVGWCAGTVAALVIFLMLFGGMTTGGWLGGGHGAPGVSSIAPTPPEEPETKPQPEAPEPKPPLPEPLATPEPKPAVVRMLGGSRVVNDRYYRLGDDGEALTLDTLKERLRAAPPEAGPDGRRRLHILIDEESVAFNHRAVRSLEEWASFGGYVVVVRRRSADSP